MLRKHLANDRNGRHLLCLLFAALIFGVWFTPALCRGESVPFNTAGNYNISPAVDPLGGSSDYLAVLYNNANGLPTSESNCITQTDDGFIWIGSYAGLIRYDGNNFERINDQTPVSNVRCLYKDSQGRLWIGTNDAGFLMMENGRLTRWNKEDGLKSLSARNFAEDADGWIYISTTLGVAVMDPEMNFAGEDLEQFEGEIHNLHRSGNGHVYALSRAGDLLEYDKGQLIGRMDAADCRIENINSMLPDPEKPGWFWLGTMGSEIYYGDASVAFENARKLDLGELREPECLELIDGKVWICARNGIGRLEGDSVTRLKDVPLDDSVCHVMTDYQGNLWFSSTRQGVMKVMPNRFEDMFAHWKMPNQVVNSTCLYDSMLFLGTDEGLTVMRDGERVKTLPLTKAVTASGKDLEETDLIEYLDKVRIRSVISDSRGNLWISTWTGDGLVRYAKGEIMVFTPEDGMASEKCRAVSECGDGSMLVAQTGGMSVIKDDRVAAVYTQEEGIENLGVLTVSEGFEGEYILGTDGGGLYIIENGEVTHIGSENGLASDVILRVRRSRAENVIWIVTGNSLAYMTPDHQVTTIESFPYANNYDLYENNKGELWVLSSSGIYVARTGQLLANAVIETAHYNIFNGLPYTATSNSYSELADDGNLYIAGSSGVIRVNIEEPFEANVEMKMSVPFVDADGVRIWPDADGNFTIPSDTHKLTVSSFVLNYAPVNPKVSYYLQSFDREPITVSLSDLTPVDYTNLKGGEYSFVMDMEDEDLSGNREVSVLIRKELAVNEQPWFWFTVLIFILMGEIWLIHIILEKMTRMIEKKKDRERIAGDLQLASQIQAAVLPKNSFEDAGKRFGLSGSMTPAKEVGGDFYDYYMIDDDHLAMIIADVSGKGIPAALFMMVSKALIKNQLMSGLTPAQALANVNQQLCENNESGMFVTVWAAVLEISTGKGLACNAGHENPGIRQGGGSFELAVYKHNLFLGVSKKAEYTDRPFEMKTGDSLFVYTDGVPEAHDPNGQMFGSQRLGEALNIDPDAGPEKLIENVRSTVREFAGKAEQYDDITMLAFKYYNSSFIG